jgi:hypothetical protein
VNLEASRFVRDVKPFLGLEHSLDESGCVHGRGFVMKTILLFLGAVGCYFVLSIAASPLDASLAPTETRPPIRSGGRAIGQAPAATGVSASKSLVPDLPGARRQTLPNPTGSRAKLRTDRQPPPAPPEPHDATSRVAEEAALDQFSPFFRRTEPEDTSAGVRNYLRDPWVIEELVLL